MNVLFQILISADVLTRDADWLVDLGFNEPKKPIDWFIYLAIDLILAFYTIFLLFWHHKRTKKWITFSLHAFSMSKIAEKSMIIDEASERSSLLDPVTHERQVPVDGAMAPNFKLTLPFWYKGLTTLLLIVIAVGSPSLLHIPYFVVMIILVIGRDTALWKYVLVFLIILAPTKKQNKNMSGWCATTRVFG